MNRHQKLSIVIPAYNEAHFIENTLKAVGKADALNLQKEVIIVDDGSKDETVVVVKNFLTSLSKKKGFSKVIKKGDSWQTKSKEDSWQILVNKKNKGKGAVIKQGFLQTSGDIVLVQDADLEYSPDDYPRLLEPFMTHNADVVYGSRFVTNRPHRVLYYWHYVANSLLTKLSNMLTNMNLTDMETGYKVFKGELIRDIAPTLESDSFGFEPEITAKIAKNKQLQIFEVGISYWGRTYEEGKKIGWKDGVEAVWKILKYNLFS